MTIPTEYNERLAILEQAIENNPQDFQSWFEKGKIFLLELGRYEDAVNSFNKAIEINPNSFESWHSQGQALNYLNRFEEAIISFDKALEINPESLETLRIKATILEKLDKFSAAFVLLEKILEIDPEDISYRYKKANIVTKLPSKITRENGLVADITPMLIRQAIRDFDFIINSDIEEDSTYFIEKKVSYFFRGIADIHAK